MLLGATADPHEALRRWVGLLRPGGPLLLVEGRWWGGPVDDERYPLTSSG